MNKMPDDQEAARIALEEYIESESYLAHIRLIDEYINVNDYRGLIKECRKAKEQISAYETMLSSINDPDKKEGLEFALDYCNQYWDKISGIVDGHRGSLDWSSQIMIAGNLPWILAWFKVIEFKKFDKE